MTPLWSAVDAGHLVVVTSELSLLETLVKPVREGQNALADLYRAILYSSRGLKLLPVDREVLKRAAEIRARHNLKTPDSIHAATSLSHGCSMFVTNDAEFARVPSLNLALLSEIISG